MNLDDFCESFLIFYEDAPDKLTEYCKQRAEDLGVTEEYFMMEFMI